MLAQGLLTLAILYFLLATGPAAKAQVPRTAAPSRTASGSSLRQSAWIRVSPAAEEFSVLMPGAPIMGWETQPVGGRVATMNYYGLNFDETMYAVISMGKQDAPPPELAHILMLNLFNKFLPTSVLDKVEENEQSVRSAYVHDTSLDGYPGRAHTLRAHNRSGLSNFYITGKNYYLVGALTSRKNTSSVKKFLDSFALARPAQPPTGAAPSPPMVATEQKEVVTRPAAGLTWLVVLNTYSKAEQEKADRRQAAVERLGYEARVVASDDYPNLRKGFLVLIAGPYSKGEAERVLSRVRSNAPDAYIKSGW